MNPNQRVFIFAISTLGFGKPSLILRCTLARKQRRIRDHFPSQPGSDPVLRAGSGFPSQSSSYPVLHPGRKQRRIRGAFLSESGSDPALRPGQEAAQDQKLLSLRMNGLAP